MLKSTDDIIKENPDDTYLWEDAQTIDVIVDNKEKSFINEIKDYKCLKCFNNVVHGNQKLFVGITKDVNGIQIKCNKCGQKFFIHKPIIFEDQ